MAKPEVIFLTVPPVGHVKPTVELAKLLLLSSSSSLSITILTIPSFFPSWDAATAPLISSSASAANLHFESLPAAPTSIRAGEFPDAYFARYIHAHNPLLRAALSRRLAANVQPIAALILDVFCWPAIDIARDLCIPAYIYVTWNAAMLSYMLHLPSTTISGEIVGVPSVSLRSSLLPPPSMPRSGSGSEGVESPIPTTLTYPGRPPRRRSQRNAAMLSYMLHHPSSTISGEIMRVPGMGAVPVGCAPPFILDEEARRLFVESGRRFREARGLIVNTFVGLEPAVMEAIASGECVAETEMPQVFAVGPVLAMEEEDGGRECLEWLDEQPERSVVFICLGSMGSMDANQAEEVAAVLEHSGQRFLWVLRSPIPNHPLYLPKDFTNLEEILPAGFLLRTKNKGIVWPTWVPQMKILSHHAIGGFVTHCGWNSCLESLWLGVPMLTWPLFFDQHLNAFNIVHQLELGFELRIDRKNKNFVTALEFEKGLKSLMGVEGRRLREKLVVMRSIMQKIVADRGVLKMLVDKLIKECPILK